ALGQSTVPNIHHLPQLDSAYVFCRNKTKHEQWTKEWSKVKGVFTGIDLICDRLKQDTQQCDHDSVSISVTTSGHLGNLDPSFMYTQLLKETLIEMQYDDKAKTVLANFCRDQYHDNPREKQIIDQFEQDYDNHKPIWWYTREGFTYKMLNRALRTQEVETIIQMGFFLRDVHQHIEKIHSETEYQDTLKVYRGQCMSSADLNKILQSKGALLAFNNFLSTTNKRDVSLGFACGALHNPDSVGVLFEMTVNPQKSSTPFASVAHESAFQAVEEILFSMHSVFRIGEIQAIQHRIQAIQHRIWRVELTLTTDDDPELKQLTDHFPKETQGNTARHRL
ncbi:unnamed protein product, partial [Didymodactylos carnosus]